MKVEASRDLVFADTWEITINPDRSVTIDHGPRSSAR